MPRYFFHVLRGHSRVEDPDGTELPDIASAKHEAVEDARSFMACDIGKGIDRSRSMAIEITDESGRVLLTLPFRDAVNVVP